MDQMENTFLHAQFVLRHLRNELNDSEKQKLEEWLSTNENNRFLFEELVDGKHIKHELEFFEAISIAAEWNKLTARLNKPAKIQQISSWKRWWYVAAAAVLLIGAFTLIRFRFQQPNKKNVFAVKKVIKNDMAPGGNNATLTLANGNIIILDSAHIGALATQGNAKILKLNDGQLAYTPSSGEDTEVAFNTISTPRGGQYQLTLSDGTKVWLNAASSLRYPATFSGKDRKVELTGEAYFEVAHNAAMPFKVNVAGKEEVEVLGTHFNINSYSDEYNVRTTLVEGKVKITNNNNSIFLLPSQQGILTSEGGKLTIDKDADVDKAIAWKNGLFDFDNDNITDIMRQLSRWYNVDIQYVGNITTQYYTGLIRRKVNISQVLYMLEQAGGVQFNVKQKNIIVRTK